MTTNPFQQVEQELLTNAITEAEQLDRADPAAPGVTQEQTAILAYELWQANGSVLDSPFTLNFWLEAETSLMTQAQD